LSAAPRPLPDPSRQALRERLLQARERFADGPEADAAAAALARELRAVLTQLEPHILGCYWPHRGEFNAPAALEGDTMAAKTVRALPFARRSPPGLEYRLWDGAAPRTVDECRIPTSDGAVVTPDVVLVPCVGYTASGYRLGYGGGYFDRWLAAHPGACAVGVAWADARVDEAELAPAPHDVRLAVVVTERGTV
jgi:5,10-methenyltetrahydrofolate synthetase